MLGLYTASLAAHDFWVQPNEYWLQPGVASSLTLQVGHGAFRQRSPIPAARIIRFEAVAPNAAVIDLRADLHPGAGTDDGTLRFASAGTYVLALQTDSRAQSHLPAIRFNDYLRIEGLTPALQQRQHLRQMDTDGSENYSRCAKSIVQVGPPGADSQAQVTRPLGLPLEIVPERSPYTQPLLSVLAVRVIYEDRPLAGALVKLTRLENDAVPLEMHVTDGMGRASFAMPKEGSWLLNVIWTKPHPGSRETDFETTFSSLSFGFPALAYRAHHARDPATKASSP